MKKITEIYAFITQDNDAEGIPAMQVNELMMPLIAADKARVESLKKHAKHIAKVTNKEITLKRFQLVQTIETITPGEKH